MFGEDVGPKGGVHAATMGLQDMFGPDRVFDTSLSEEGIIGNAVGMALAGLRPVAEIQFRKYAEPATEQLNDCGTMRWRTANKFAAPIVVRMPGGFGKCGDPWHSVSSEVTLAHAIGLAGHHSIECRRRRRSAASGAAQSRIPVFFSSTGRCSMVLPRDGPIRAMSLFCRSGVANVVQQGTRPHDRDLGSDG